MSGRHVIWHARAGAALSAVWSLSVFGWQALKAYILLNFLRKTIFQGVFPALFQVRYGKQYTDSEKFGPTEYVMKAKKESSPARKGWWRNLTKNFR